MRRRVLTVILSVTAIAVALFAVPLAIVVEHFVESDAKLRVERLAVLASRQVPADFNTGTDPVELPETDKDTRVALYDRNGKLITGSGPANADDATQRALGNLVADGEGHNARIVAVPVAVDEVVVGVLRAEQTTAASAARTHRIWVLLAALALGVMAVAGVIGWLLAGRLARPVRDLRDAAVQLGEGDFTVTVPSSTISELHDAGQAMTATARRLDDLVTRERSFSADASHQLRTPLAGLRAAIETELKFPRADAALVLHDALTDIDRLERTIAELLTIARTPTVTSMPVVVAEVFAEVAESWSKRFAAAGRTLSVASARFCPDLVGNASMLRHAMDVLLDNSLIHGQGSVTVEQSFTPESVTISVTDEGPGFPAPLDDSQAPDARSGIGLPLAGRLVDAMHGRLVVARSGPQPRIDITLRRM
jgi:signal transduction histidine kinase